MRQPALTIHKLQASTGAGQKRRPGNSIVTDIRNGHHSTGVGDQAGANTPGGPVAPGVEMVRGWPRRGEARRLQMGALGQRELQRQVDRAIDRGGADLAITVHGTGAPGQAPSTGPGHRVDTRPIKFEINFETADVRCQRYRCPRGLPEHRRSGRGRVGGGFSLECEIDVPVPDSGTRKA